MLSCLGEAEPPAVRFVVDTTIFTIWVAVSYYAVVEDRVVAVRTVGYSGSISPSYMTSECVCSVFVHCV